MLYWAVIAGGGGLPEKKFATELTTFLKNPPSLLDFLLFAAHFIIGISADFTAMEFNAELLVLVLNLSEEDAKLEVWILSISSSYYMV